MKFSLEKAGDYRAGAGGIYGIKICDVTERNFFGRSDMQSLETLENTYFLTNVWEI
ncbi:hypothetical protein [Clostridium transplantifaecale]|uniref:hypothetical protein n=1 Tax=Clostridium transplantifaecale TaxID=2479838 RepID=UPI0013DE762B|nr:hypothetical protein [Clostridium transplantifaecale]